MNEENMKRIEDKFNKLIDILNHNVTEIRTDVKWIMRIAGWSLTISATLGVSILIKLILGAS